MLRRAAVRRDRLHAEHVATQALLKAVRRELASFRALHDEQRVQPAPRAPVCHVRNATLADQDPVCARDAPAAEACAAPAAAEAAAEAAEAPTPAESAAAEAAAEAEARAAVAVGTAAAPAKAIMEEQAAAVGAIPSYVWMAVPEDWDNFCQGPLECDEAYSAPEAVKVGEPVQDVTVVDAVNAVEPVQDVTVVDAVKPEGGAAAAQQPTMRCQQVLQCIEEFVRNHLGWKFEVQTQPEPPANVAATYWGNSPFVMGFLVECGPGSGNNLLFEHVNAHFAPTRNGVPIAIAHDRFVYAIRRKFELIGLVAVHEDGRKGHGFRFREPVVFQHCPVAMKKFRDRLRVRQTQEGL
eukprot:3936419-Rhodomonas_salina.3